MRCALSLIFSGFTKKFALEQFALQKNNCANAQTVQVIAKVL